MGYSSSSWDREPTPKITSANLLELNRDQGRLLTVQASYTEQGPSQRQPLRHARQNCNEQQNGARRKLLDVLDQALAILAEEWGDKDEDE
jgi:hypothetical protein